jgi:hypothetical protein
MRHSFAKTPLIVLAELTAALASPTTVGPACWPARPPRSPPRSAFGSMDVRLINYCGNLP